MAKTKAVLIAFGVFSFCFGLLRPLAESPAFKEGGDEVFLKHA